MINLCIIDKDEVTVLNNLLQLYLHDLSLYFPIEFDSKTGLYKYELSNKYFDNSNNKAFFIKNDEDIVGFILIDYEDNHYIVQEIFTLNNYKGNGYAKEAIINVFNMYKGNWIIKVVPNSFKAEIFWNRVISEYTKNKFKVIHEGKYSRAVFTFNNK